MSTSCRTCALVSYALAARCPYSPSDRASSPSPGVHGTPFACPPVPPPRCTCRLPCGPPCHSALVHVDLIGITPEHSAGHSATGARKTNAGTTRAGNTTSKRSHDREDDRRHRHRPKPWPSNLSRRRGRWTDSCPCHAAGLRRDRSRQCAAKTTCRLVYLPCSRQECCAPILLSINGCVDIWFRRSRVMWLRRSRVNAFQFIQRMT